VGGFCHPQAAADSLIAALVGGGVGEPETRCLVGKRTRGTLMSRGLGRLQRFIKDQIYRAERDYRREGICLFARMKTHPDFDPSAESVKSFWLTWPDIRMLVEENPDFNHGPYRISGPGESIEPIIVGPSGPIWFPRISPALERSAKRALHALVKRGEIAKLWKAPGPYLTRYVTKEMDQELRDTDKAFAEGFARLAAEGKTIEDSIREFKEETNSTD
jgi:hypothetical protein